MANQLKSGVLARMFTGISELAPVLQILYVARTKDGPEESTRLLVSDGQWSSCFAALDISLTAMVLSGQISQNCIVQIEKYALMNINTLLIKDLTVLESGAAVGQRIGNPQPFKFNNDKTSNSAQVAKPAYKPPVPLTRGALADIFEDGMTPEGPVLQILNIYFKKSYPKRYRLVLNDGQWSNSFAMLTVELNDDVESGKISENSIIQLNKYICNTGEYNMKCLYIDDLTILKSGADIGQRIEKPLPMATKLTKGILAVISRGATPEVPPVLQILSISRELTRSTLNNTLILSDGMWSSKLAILDPCLDDKVKSEEISKMCIIIINKFTVSLEDDIEIQTLKISDVEVIQSGADVGQQIGQPEDIKGGGWPPYLMQSFENTGVYVKEAISGITKGIWQN